MLWNVKSIRKKDFCENQFFLNTRGLKCKFLLFVRQITPIWILATAMTFLPGCNYANHGTEGGKSSSYYVSDAKVNAAHRNNLLVTDFGAKGDGKTLNTAFIQAGIDAASKASCSLVFPPGTYLSGTLNLRDNVTLYFVAEAKLLGSDQLKHYTVNETAKDSSATNQCLIYAHEVKNITLTGPGIIDGQGAAFPYGAEGINFEYVKTLSVSLKKFIRRI